jgi:hypothetical protein
MRQARFLYGLQRSLLRKVYESASCRMRAWSSNQTGRNGTVWAACGKWELKKLGMKGWYIPKATAIHMVPEHKCNIKHIGGRNEAYGIEMAKVRYESPIESSVMRRVPYWMYKSAFGAWVRWIGRQLVRRKGHREDLKCE